MSSFSPFVLLSWAIAPRGWCHRDRHYLLLQTTFLLLQSLKGSSLLLLTPSLNHIWFMICYNFKFCYDADIPCSAHTSCLLMMLRGQGPFPAASTCMEEDGGWQVFPFFYSLLDMMEDVHVSLHVALTEKPLSLTSASGLLSEMFDHWALCWTVTTPPQMQERGSLFQISESESNYIQIVKGWKWDGLRKG